MLKNKFVNFSVRPKRIKETLILFTLGILFVCGSPFANANSRIKDLVSFEGVRENQLVGYGLVVGLNGTGDTLRNAPFTQQSMIAMLERLETS